MESKLTDNEKLVLFVLVEYPDLNDIGHSKNQLLKEEHYLRVSEKPFMI